MHYPLINKHLNYALKHVIYIYINGLYRQENCKLMVVHLDMVSCLKSKCNKFLWVLDLNFNEPRLTEHAPRTYSYTATVVLDPLQVSVMSIFFPFGNASLTYPFTKPPVMKRIYINEYLILILIMFILVESRK